jgi:hypothetical protein
MPMSEEPFSQAFNVKMPMPDQPFSQAFLHSRHSRIWEHQQPPFDKTYQGLKPFFKLLPSYNFYRNEKQVDAGLHGLDADAQLYRKSP